MSSEEEFIDKKLFDTEILYCIDLMRKKYSKIANFTNFESELLISLKKYLLKINKETISKEEIKQFVEKMFIKKNKEFFNDDVAACNSIINFFKELFSENISDKNVISELEKLNVFFKCINYNPTIDLIVDVINNNKSLQDYLSHIISNKNEEYNVENELLQTLINGYNLINDIYDISDFNIEYIDSTSFDDTDILTLYLNDIKHSLLSKEEEIDLAIKVKNGDRKARHMLIEKNLLLVVSVANKFKFRGIELMDLISEGNIGLMKAVDHFDPSKGYKFSTYAIWWIRNYILKSIYSQSKLIKIPNRSNYIMAKYDDIKTNLSKEFDREPIIDEIADEIGLSKEKLVDVICTSRSPLSLSCDVNDDTDLKLEEIVPSTETPVVDEIINREISKKVSEVLDSVLDTREFSIVALRFGLIDGKEWSLNRIGIKYGLSRERIRQIESRALKKLSHQKTLIKLYNK